MAYYDPTAAGGGGGGGGWGATNNLVSPLGSLIGKAANVAQTAQSAATPWEDGGYNTDASPTWGVSGGGTPAYDPNELRQFDEQKSLYERLMQSADSMLNSGINNLNDSYNRSRTRTEQDQSKALGDYNYKRQETEKGREQSLNQVGDNSRMLRNSLMRVLGLASGGGSAFDMANMATAREATKNRSNVLENYTGNIRGLDRAEDDAKTQFQRLLEDLTVQKQDREESLRSGVAQQKQSIQGELAQLMADRARLLGGDQFAAAQPYRNSYLDYQNQIDQLPQQYRTAVDYKQPTLQQPTLNDYNVNRASINGSAPGRQTQYSPYSNFLQRKEDEQRLA